jgi:hypothetical protein
LYTKKAGLRANLVGKNGEEKENMKKEKNKKGNNGQQSP